MYIYFFHRPGGEQQQLLLLYSERVAAVAVYITIMVCGKTFTTLFGTGHARKYKRVYIMYIHKKTGPEAEYIHVFIYIYMYTCVGEVFGGEGRGGDNNYRLPTNEVR